MLAVSASEAAIQPQPRPFRASLLVADAVPPGAALLMGAIRLAAGLLFAGVAGLAVFVLVSLPDEPQPNSARLMKAVSNGRAGILVIFMRNAPKSSEYTNATALMQLHSSLPRSVAHCAFNIPPSVFL